MSLRIQMGRLKGRRVPTAELGVRPSMAWTRMVLMNWLYDRLNDAFVLDLCAGSGILSFESLSLGAKAAWCLDAKPGALSVIARQADAWQLPVKTACHTWPKTWSSGGMSFDIIFWDPPYQAPWRHDIFQWIEAGAWLKEGGVLCVESSSRDGYEATGWSLLKSKKRSDTQVTLWEYSGAV